MNRLNVSLVVAAALLSACTPPLPIELANARHAYQQTSNSTAATVVPAEVHKAKVALDEAEAAFQADPRGYHTTDLAYVAQRRAQLADALAASSIAQRSASDATSEYGSTQAAMLDSAQARLGTTQAALATSQAVGAQTARQLSASEIARAQAEEGRAAAEARAALSMEALAKLAAVKEEARGMVITLSGSVLFRSGEDALLPEARNRIAQVTAALLETKDRHIVVEGHTDSQGTDTDNLALSQRRADAVRTLIVEGGYDAAFVRAVGVGEGRPLADNVSPEGRANNRRVEIVVAPASAAL